MSKPDGYLRIDTRLNNDEFKKGLEKLKSAGVKAAMATGAAIGTALYQGMNFESAMSEVAAISGATGKALDALTEKAKEMGAKTVFSATQSAEAFKYMAMAGWKTEEMLSGIEGIMNLAAASGEDLGLVSDIVTDALTAFGLTAQDSTHFADVLAAASSNANTNVSMIGETFKYVAPVAGALGYTIEDTALAIGLMANAGIKASQAGTSLRQIFSRLAKPTKEVETAMSELGVSITDSEGKIKPLNVLIQDFRKSFAKLTDAQKPTYAAMIAGQEAMSGLLAIVNAAPADLKKLSGAIENADGTAQDMADTMQDNLKGNLTILASAAEGLAISFYEGINEPLKNAVKEGTKSIDTLNDSLKSGSLNGAIKGVGNLLAETVKILVNITNAVLPPLITVLGFVGKNIELITVLIIPAIAGLTTYKTIIILTSAALKTASAAQGTFNALVNANPFVKWIVVGASVLSFFAAFDSAITRSSKRLSDFEKANAKVNAKIKEASETRNQLSETTKKNIEAHSAEVARIQALANELKTLSDASGKVEEKDRSRVSYILGELNNALGTEYKMIDGEIQKYGELASSIDTVIAKMQIRGLIESMEAEYNNSLDKFNKAVSDMLETETKIADLKKEIKNAEKAMSESGGIGNQAADIRELKEQLEGLEGTYKNQCNAVEEYSNTISTVQKLAAAESTGDIEKINNALADHYTVFNKGKDFYLKSQSEQLDILKKGIDEQLKQVKYFSSEFEKTNDDMYLSYINTSKEAAQNAIKEFIDAGGKIPELAQIFKSSGVDIIAGLTDGTKEGEADFLAELSSLSRLSVSELKAAFEIHSPSALTAREIGKPLIQGISNGAEGQQGILSETMRRIVRNAVDAAKKEGEIHSPSRLTRDKIGAPLVDGIAVGIIDNGYKVSDAVSAMFDDLELKHDIGIYTDDEYYADMEKLRDNYIKKGTKQWWDYTKKLVARDKNKLEESHKKQAEMFENNLKNEIDALERNYSIREKLGIASAEEEAEINKKKGQAYAKYCENIKNATFFTEEEKLKKLKEYAEKSQDCFIDAYTVIADSAKDKFSELSDTLESALDDIESKEKTFADKLKNHAPTVTPVTFVGGLSGDETFYTLTDFDKKTDEITKYNNLLDSVLSRSNSKNFNSYILGLGIEEAQKVAYLLSSLSENDFNKYVEDYEKFQKVSDGFAFDRYAPEKEEAYNTYETGFEKITEETKDKLKDTFGDVPDEFFDVGTESGEQFENGFLSVFETVADKVKQKFSDIVAEFKIKAAGATDDIKKTSYSSTYNLIPSSTDITTQLRTIRDNEKLNEMRGGY